MRRRQRESTKGRRAWLKGHCPPDLTFDVGGAGVIVFVLPFEPCLVLRVQEFAKTMEPECIKADLIQLFHNLANDEQVRTVPPINLAYPHTSSLFPRTLCVC